MATPNAKSYEQILGEMLGTYMGKIGVNDLNVGGAMLSFFEAMAQAIYRATGDVFSIQRDYSVDRASGEILKRIATEEGVKLQTASVTTGKVTITDISFSKKSTKIYAGANPPNVGSLVLKVSDASLFPAADSVYVGRGTSNIEGPLPYTSITLVGSYYEINLSSPTTKYHNISESVILAQGGVRNIPTGTLVKTSASGSSSVVNFTTTQNAIILDGDTEIINVPVAAQEPGTTGNVPRGAIKEFSSAPFDGATVTNPNTFTTGSDDPSDSEIRIAIKKARASKGLGTAIAVKNSVLGVKAKDENAKITSDEIFTVGGETTLYIDNGSGYEEKTAGVGLEFIVDSALGGETNFQLSTGGKQTSIAKAFLETTLISPFSLFTNDRLAVLVGGIVSEHVFASGDFKAEGYATAYEVVSSINADSSLSFDARTTNNGTKVVISAKAEINENIKVTTPSVGTNASIALGFPSNEVETLRLYKNRLPLTKNGKSAQIESAEQNDWSATIATGDTLIVKVDSTSFITYTFIDADFIAEGSHTTVAKSNTLNSWINVINSKVIGLTATINGTRLVLTSNLGAKARAKIEIDASSTLVTKGMFIQSNGLIVTGAESDYELSRNTAQLKLTPPLSRGDSLTTGTEFTQGFLTSGAILGGSVTLSSDGYLWLIVDNSNISIINTGVIADTVIHFEKQINNVVRLRSEVANAFVNVLVGDYLVLWSNEFNAANRIEGRVYNKGTNTLANDYVELRLTPAEYALTSNQSTIVFKEGLIIARTEAIPQKVKIAAGAYNINTIANNINNTLIGAKVSVDNDELLVVTTDTKNLDGSIYLMAINEGAKALNFTALSSGQSITSHYAFYESSDSDQDFPSFIHAKVNNNVYADVPNAAISSFESNINLETLVDPNIKIEMLNPYLSSGSYIPDAQAKSAIQQVLDLTTTTVDLNPDYIIRRLRQYDRFCLLNPYDFSYNDQIITILDNDAVNKTFPVSLFRRALTNNTISVNPNNFRAYDVDSGTSIQFSQFFGSGFNFNNYKVFMQAKNAIDPVGSVDEDAILFRSVLWGRTGEHYNVGYTYPTAANSSVAHVMSTESLIKIRLILKSGAAVPNTIDGSTQWDVTKLTNTPVAGVDTVTYTWNSIGSNPNMTSLVSGSYVTINNKGDFDLGNIGTFKISAASSSSFSVHMPNGIAVAENNVATVESNVILLYEKSDTTAQDIADYVTSNLSNYITATVLNDNGTTGAGVISESTYENNLFATNSDGVSLVDGINWIKVTDLAAIAPNPNFTFKTPLTLSYFNTNTANAFAFNNGEELRLIPTTTKQVKELISVLAVSGFSTAGEITVANRNAYLQLATNILGSSGALQITGGTGNSTEADIIGASSLISGTNFLKFLINKSASLGLHGDQWIKLQGANAQKKVSGISLTTNVTIVPNSPIAGFSTIEMGNREIQDRYFGQPRNHIRDRSRVFHLEKHGKFVCISWNEAGSAPVFSKTVEFNDDAGNMSVVFNTTVNLTEYTVESGSKNFCEVAPGDIIIIQNFTDAGNNGTFTVMGVSDDGLTISVDNANGVNAISAATTAGDIVISTTIKEGDFVTIGEPFTAINRGIFPVIQKYNNSIYIDNPSAVEEVVSVVSNLRTVSVDPSAHFDVQVNGDMIITWNSAGTQPDFSDVKLGDIVTVGTAFNADNQGNFMVTSVSATSFTCANSKAVAEVDVQVTGAGADVLEFHILALVFNPYENTNVADNFVITGNILGTANIGSHVVSEIITKNKIVVNGIRSAQTAVPLSNSFAQVFIREANPYVGYKKIHTLLVDASNSNRMVCIVGSTEQSNKINQADGAIGLSAVGKLNFSSLVVNGLDSYRYHMGLVAEANRIVYGDPRDSVTYPGVSAAGAEIFIKTPLVRNIIISINVRVQTGIPWNKIVEQVRNNIASLINASPIGQSIAISDIIATVNRIPGTKAISISSPSYSPSNDIIVVGPSEKPLILDVINNIIVSKIE
jgi:hypothetical protein